MTDNGAADAAGSIPYEPDVVTYERRGAIAVVTLNRPDYRNAQNSVMTYAIDAAFERAVADPEVKVIVL
ncbi:MAG: enoyl-CoA hydratase, partial [Nocardia sp.]|nr:enoyl-CoA hydratase [Nocardia sp.]